MIEDRIKDVIIIGWGGNPIGFVGKSGRACEILARVAEISMEHAVENIEQFEMRMASTQDNARDWFRIRNQKYRQYSQTRKLRPIQSVNRGK